MPQPKIQIHVSSKEVETALTLFDRHRFRQWLHLFRTLWRSPKPEAADSELWYRIQGLSFSHEERELLGDITHAHDLQVRHVGILQDLVQRIGEDWTDLPQDNGLGVYRTTLPDNLLLRGLLLRRHLQRGHAWPDRHFQQVMGLQGGGQITDDRFSVSPEKLGKLFSHLHELYDAGTLPLRPFTMIGEEYGYLHEEFIVGRFLLAYRWFKNRSGILPPLRREGIDYPSKSLLGFAEEGDSGIKFPSGKLVTKKTAETILTILAEQVEVHGKVPEVKELPGILRAISRAVDKGFPHG